ncbi:hypothetical protein BaRGS_00005189 [Batillaria attramentaria]|uniref:Uncharacterized protein n=1 Tax=Batillaria attramentaria TaxID=370345 RepID=A0ABD0LVX9_9CAEN
MQEIRRRNVRYIPPADYHMRVQSSRSARASVGTVPCHSASYSHRVGAPPIFRPRKKCHLAITEGLRLLSRSCRPHKESTQRQPCSKFQ